MPTFWDLPKDVRDIIYRHHLIYDKPITIDVHRKAIAHHDTHWSRRPERFMPPIFHLSKKAEREATPFYYGMNTFDVRNLEVRAFTSCTYPRHWNQVQKVVCTWERSNWSSSWGAYGNVKDSFVSLSKMKKLEEMSIRIDEAEMIKMMSVTREIRQRPYRRDLTAQQSLAILRFPGMTGLLTLTRVKHVNFVKLVDSKGVETGGMIPGGPLETHILPRLKPRLKGKRQKKGSFFRFLDLPPEFRNHVYHLLLRIPGPINPSKEPPTSAPKDPDDLKVTESEHTESALSILAACKQMNEEGMGIFYHCNSFVFHYPIQLNTFVLDLGLQRQNMIRDITIYYHNLKLGGVELIDTTFPLLLQLKGLRKLHVLMVAQFCEGTLRRGWIQNRWSRRSPDFGLQDTNPALIPGMRTLFRLRGLTDIRIRDVRLDEKVEELKNIKTYPNFGKDTPHANIVQLSKAFEHFNGALADAQLGGGQRDAFREDPVADG